MTVPRPCPFCGSTCLENFAGNFIKCIDCHARGPVSPIPVERWNGRRGTLGGGSGGGTVTGSASLRSASAHLGGGQFGPPEPPPPAPQPSEPPPSDNRSVDVDAIRREHDAVIDARAVRKARTDLHAGSGVRVQCGPLLLLIPSGFHVSATGHSLIVSKDGGGSVWELVQWTGGKGAQPDISFSTDR